MVVPVATFCDLRSPDSLDPFLNSSFPEFFSSIQENTLSIQSGIQNLTVSTSELKDANQVISDSVQTLSAISEELTAHAHETLEAENKNTDILDTIASKMQELVIFTQNQF